MRRGLISWSREEVPVAVLEARVARLQAAMRAEGLAAVLVYTSFAQPAAVHWLTHFVPYWNEALLAVFPAGEPVLLAALTKRVHPWIREVSHIGEIMSSPRLGQGAAALLGERLPPAARVGVVGLESLPWSVAEPLVKAGRGESLVDVGGLYAALRQPADAAEIELAVRAAAIAAAALRAIPPGARRASEAIAAVEGAARLAGAEEVLQRLAPDLGRDATLARIEGDAPLGARYALELSLAYKSTWVRLTRCIATEAAPASWQAAERWLAEAAAALDETRAGHGPAGAPGRLDRWLLEASTGLHPLSVAAASGIPPVRSLPAGSLAVFSVCLDLADGPWHGSVPLVIAPRGGRARLLAG